MTDSLGIPFSTSDEASGYNPPTMKPHLMLSAGAPALLVFAFGLSAAVPSALIAAGAAARPAAPRSVKGSTPDDLVRQGQDLYRKGELGEALLLFEEAVKGGAEGGELFYQMGYCYKMVRGDALTSKSYMAKAAPLLEKTIETAKTAAPFYYLSAIYTNELSDSAKGAVAAHKGIALAEQGAFAGVTDGQGLFQIGRLHSLVGQSDKAVAWYQKAWTALSTDKTPNRQYQISTAEQLSNYYNGKQDSSNAATWMARLVDLDPTRQKERLSTGILLIKAARYNDALKTLDGFSDDELATEANYLSRVVRKYVELGMPPLPAGAAKLDDTALQEALEKSAGKLGDIRKKEDDAAKTVEPEELPFKWVTSKSGSKAKVYPPRVYPPADWQPKDPNHPTPDEVNYMMGIPPSAHKPPPPPTPERTAAEKEFFSLLLETVKRGHPVREMALTRGLTSVIYQ